MDAARAGPPVIIAGAGPAGLSLALALARAGVRSTLFEKESGLPPHSRAIVVWPRTLEFFRAIGARDAIAARGEVLGAVAITDADREKVLFALDFERTLRAETLEPAPIALPQETTEAVLFETLAATRACDVRFNHEVVGLTQDEAGVTVRVRDAAGLEREERTAYLVGADGAHGAVRGALGMKLEGETYDTRVALADIEIDGRETLTFPRIALRGGTIAAAVRFGARRWRLILPLRPGQSDATATSKPFLDAAVARVLGPGPYETTWSSVFNIHRRRTKSFVVGRVALAGDAAHLNSPAGGQGMNAGIADAQNLAWKLAAILSGADARTLLASYDEERGAAFSEGVARNTDRLTQLGLNSWAPLRRSGLRIFKLMLRIPPLRRKMIRSAAMLDVRYGHSPIIFGHGPLIGARAPDPVLAAGGPATLVTYRLPKNLANTAANLLKVRLRALERKEARRWGTRRPFAALVRPDGIVGWMAPKPQPDEIELQVRAALGRPVPPA